MLQSPSPASTQPLLCWCGCGKAQICLYLLFFLLDLVVGVCGAAEKMKRCCQLSYSESQRVGECDGVRLNAVWQSSFSELGAENRLAFCAALLSLLPPSCSNSLTLSLCLAYYLSLPPLFFLLECVGTGQTASHAGRERNM